MFCNFNLIGYSSHGLSYTAFSLKDLKLSEAVVSNNEFKLNATLSVTNTGQVPGSEVVQLYVTLPATSDLTHPPLQLKAFAKVRDLAPGGTEQISLQLDKYAVSYWDDRFSTWSVEVGEYLVRVGTSSASLPLKATFAVKQAFEWRGL